MSYHRNSIVTPRRNPREEIARLRERLVLEARDNQDRQDMLCRALRRLLNHPGDVVALADARYVLEQCDPCEQTIDEYLAPNNSPIPKLETLP